MSTALLVGLIEFGILMVVFFGLGLTGWIPSSKDDDCLETNDCYCERVRTGMVKQPANTWSNLGFVAAGLVILGMVGGSVAAPGNPMTGETLLAILYGAVVIYLGPGSMFFHASLKQWGGWLDTFSMIIFTSYLLLYDLVRLVFRADETVFLVLFIIVNVGLAALTWWLDQTRRGMHILGLSPGSFFFALFAVLWAVLQLLVLLAGVGDVSRDGLPFLVAILCFGAAFVIWQLSKTGGPLCKPDTWLQGHAFWHLLGAATAFFIFLYFRSEMAI